MDAGTNVEPHGALMQLYHKIKDCKSWLLHHDALQTLGIRATQVALTGKESLQFEPCFFRPHPEKLIPLCYFNARRDEDDCCRNSGSNPLPENPFTDRPSLPINPRPIFDTILEEAQKNTPNGDYLGAANSRYSYELHTWASKECEMDLLALELWECMEFYLDMPLEHPSDPAEDFTLRDLEKLDSWVHQGRTSWVLRETILILLGRDQRRKALGYRGVRKALVYRGWDKGK